MKTQPMNIRLAMMTTVFTSCLAAILALAGRAAIAPSPKMRVQPAPETRAAESHGN